MLEFVKRLFGRTPAPGPTAGQERAEPGLRASEQQFATLVAGVRDYAVFLLDAGGRVVTWNAGAERIKGYAAAEIVGRHFSTFYPREALDRGWPAHELEVAAATGRFEDEGWRVRKDGSRFWASVVITALRDEGGAVRGFLKITRDLTDRKRAEETARRLAEEAAARQAAEAAAREVEREREHLHVTLASIGDAVIATDTGGRVTFLNAVAAGLTGWATGEAAGRPLAEVFRIVNEETRRPAENPVGRVIRENRVVGLANHTALIARDGSEVPIEDSAAPIRNRDGSVGGAVLVFRDVTEARRALEARLRLAAIVESTDDAIVGKNLNAVVTSWNRGAERLYGYTAEEMVGRSIGILFPPDRPDELPAIMGRVRRGERVTHYDTVRVRKDGTRFDVAVTVSPVTDADGRVIGASKIARDITARKEEERRRTEFLATLAHELRNPLAPIRSGLQVLRLAGDDRAAAEKARGVMERQLAHLVRLVDDLLDVSRISRGKLELRTERIPLGDAVEHALEVCGQGVRDTGHELTVTVPPEPIVVDADKTRLAQAVCNLLSNAAKYTDRGGRVWLTVAREGAEAVIRVRDTGVGIPRDQLPHVFDLFMQVDRTLEKSQGGLGVGLAIVRRLVEMHGGAVEAHSGGPGAGSEFVIRLPAVPAAAGPAAAGGEAARPAGGRRVLVVDDNVDAAESLAVMLRIMGNEVAVAHDGEAGVAAAAAFRPDAVFMDIGMPRLNGFEAARRIRAEPWGKGLVLAAVTGWGQAEDRRRSAEAGFDHHLTKPADPAAVAALLAGLPAAG